MLPAFDSLISSNVRVRILMRLFLNPVQKAYLRELSTEFKVSPSQIKGELDNLSDSGLLKRSKAGRQINFSANTEHDLFPELQSMVRKALGMDRILESIVQRLGDLDHAFLIDDYAEGKDTGIIDLVLVGNIDRGNLDDLVRKTERYVGRKIRVLTLTQDEYAAMRETLDARPSFDLWRRDGGQVAGAPMP